MYLNIILTLIFLIFSGNLWANVGYGYRQEEKQNEVIEKQRELNDYMVMLHEEMIRELKRINGGSQ